MMSRVALAVVLATVLVPRAAQAQAGMFKEDTAHASGQFGYFGLAVRKDAGGTLCDTDGDFCPYQLDASGQVRVIAPLPTGAATEATLAGIKTGTDKIPASPSTDRTTAAGPFAVRLSDGAAFLSPATDRTTAAGPFSLRLSDGAAFYDAAKTGQLPAALDGSGFLKVHEQGTATVTGSVTANIGTSGSLALDATLTGRMPAGSTPADNESNAATTTRLGTFNFVYDGTTWDRWPGDSANGAKVQVAAALPAGGNNIGDVDVLTLPANASVNQTQVNGVAVAVGNGAVDTGTQRLTLAQRRTYAASTTLKTATAAGTGPFFTICGSATQTIRIQQFIVSGTVATAAVWGDVVLKKTSAATSAGTATALTKVPLDSNSAAATANAVNYYTVLATAGTLVGAIASQTQLFPVTAISATLQPTPVPLEFKWRDQDSESPVLRGTAQCMEANFGTTTTNAPTLTVSVKWTEE